MEPHPVPQNIIDVEFKLFGAFTLRQFSKILIGSLLGVGIFLLNINPLIKFPLILISVFTGILLAIIPNFGVWLFGFLKALFISPRYVWVKEAVTPEVLVSQKPRDPSNDLNISSAMGKKKINIDELPLDKLFGVTQAELNSRRREDDFEDAKNENMTRSYDDIFGNVRPKTSTEILIDQRRESIQQTAQAQRKVSPVQEAIQRARNVNPIIEDMEREDTPERTIEDYNDEIQKLKYQLSMLNKDQFYKENEQKILDRIGELYREIKMVQGEKIENKEERVLKQKIESRTVDTIDGRIVFGIVVDKRDRPIQNATVTFINQDTQDQISVTTSGEGKFTTEQSLPKGNYAVSLSDSSHKFHTYKIEVGEQKLPGFKFREK